MARPNLSLCMIVRDEERMLPGFLTAVAGLWDELVVADTGSTDRTREILTGVGATIVDHPWQDDFAAARNASLAPANGHWIMYLDADERLSGTLGDEIRNLLQDPAAGAATVVMRNELPGGHRRDAHLLRLFRNDPQIRFRHRIHEDVTDAVHAFLRQHSLALRHLEGVVHHLGYVREVAAARDKKARDQTLLQAAVTENPDDLYCWFKLIELARFWDDRPLWRQTAASAAIHFDQADQADLRRHVWSGELAALIAQGLAADPTTALSWLESRAERVHTSTAWHLHRGLLLEKLGRDADAESSFNVCLQEPDGASQELHDVRSRLGLCRLAATRGDLALARTHALAAVDTGPQDPEALLAAVTFIPLADDQTQLERFLADHLQSYPAATRPLAEALMTAGRPAQAFALLQSPAKDDPHAALGLVVCALALGRNVDLQIDLDQEMADETLQAWVRALWSSRDSALLTAFADHAVTVTDVFPWLPEFMREETQRLAR